jgi:manganese transport protein
MAEAAAIRGANAETGKKFRMSDTVVHSQSAPQAAIARGLSGRASRAAQETVLGRRHGLAGFLPFVGPAVIASVAYMDPGNFATNIQAGARYGYGLLWVVVLANLVAMLFQALSARLGIVTGQSLAELSRASFPRPVTLAMWVVSEIAAMATDLAETVGAAIGLSLLLGLPLLTGLGLTMVLTWGLLTLQSRGFRPIELVIAGFVGLIGLCYLIELTISPPDWRLFAWHAVVPEIHDAEALTLAVGIVGATVMPHAIYLHSALMPGRVQTHNRAEKATVLRHSNTEVMIALTFAGLVNLAMVAMAASMFHEGHPEVAEIETAYHTLLPLMGGFAALVFMTSLLASGLSSSVVGTMAGQTIMQDFVGFRTPLWLRRLLTMLPAFVVVAIGVDPTRALVLSQVVLSLALPVPMISLMILVFRRDVMGVFRPGIAIRILSVLGTVVVLGLNLVLLAQVAGV